MFALNQVIQRISPATRVNRVGPIGLECAVNELHLVQLETVLRGGIRVRAKASVSYQEERADLLQSPRELRALIRKALGKGRFKGRKVVTAMPSGETRIMPLSYHVNPGQGDASIILKLMEERLDGNLTEYVIDYLPIRAGNQADDHSALVAIARREAVVEYLEALRKSGLEVDCLEIGPVAIRRLVASMAPEGKRENVLVINCGRGASFLTIISGNRLLLDQAVQFGEDMLLAQIAGALDMPEPSVRKLVDLHSLDPRDGGKENALVAVGIDVATTLQEILKPSFLELVDEINRALIYMASQTHGESVDRIYLLGSVARWQGADKLLNELLVLPVETIPNPLKTFRRSGVPEAVNEIDAAPEIAVATGLALRGLRASDD
ncbi:MAG: pilus assembly protein PilM [Pseudomonadota bacterium]|nr:pilus assembly protein PilM [Pseudomonadota bacterium]